MCARVAMATEAEGACAGKRVLQQRFRPLGCGGIRQAGKEGREGRVGRQTEAERSEMTGEQVGGWRHRQGRAFVCRCALGGMGGCVHHATLGKMA